MLPKNEQAGSLTFQQNTTEYLCMYAHVILGFHSVDGESL
jgi:hypothetical protein